MPINDGSQTEERTFVDAQAFERQVNQRTLRNLRNFSLGALAALFVASLAVGWVIAGRVLAPIAHITQVAREIQAAELSRRIELDGPDDELKRLADTFDSMLARLDVAFASQRRFVADASHELRTPLAIIKTNLELALTDEDGTDESRARAAAVIERAIDRMARLTDDLLALARLDAPAAGKEPVLLVQIVADARDEFAAAAAARNVALEAADGPGWVVSGDRDVLKRAVVNLLDNAVRVAPPGSSVRLDHGEEDGWAWLAVSDEGPGIAPEHLESIFDRFWRADEARTRPTAAAGSVSPSSGRSPRRTAARSRCARRPGRERPSSCGCRSARSSRYRSSPARARPARRRRSRARRPPARTRAGCGAGGPGAAVRSG